MDVSYRNFNAGKKLRSIHNRKIESMYLCCYYIIEIFLVNSIDTLHTRLLTEELVFSLLLLALVVLGRAGGVGGAGGVRGGLLSPA